jgi:hypothetical protein
MRGRQGVALLGVSMTVAGLAVAGCGGSGSSGKASSAAAMTSPAASSTAASPAAPSSTPAPTTPSPTEKQFTGAQLKNGLLPVSALAGSAQYADGGTPTSSDKSHSTVEAIANADCDTAITGSLGSVATASETAQGYAGGNKVVVGVWIDQYLNGDAQLAITAIKQVATGRCASYDTPAANDNPASHSTTAFTAATGPGDQAWIIDTTSVTQGYPTDHIRNFHARYGDVMITATCATEQGSVQACGLPDKVKAIAAKLGLS